MMSSLQPDDTPTSRGSPAPPVPCRAVIKQETSVPFDMVQTSFSLTDMTLEQAATRLQEMQKENIALRDNLRQHNEKMKGQYTALAEWRNREQDKFEQTKALIIALKSDNQEFQVKVMTLEDKQKDLEAQVTSLETEKGHLQRQKALSDQKAFNIAKQAEEQGVEGLKTDLADDVVFVSTVDKEHHIQDLEASLAQKDDKIAALRANLLKAEEEVSKYRDSTKQLLKDMEAQQKLKASVEEENRTLQGQIMQAERQLHQHMQDVIQSTKHVLQVDKIQASSPLTSTGSRLPSLPDSMEELGRQAISSNSPDRVALEGIRRDAYQEREAKAKVEQRVIELEEQLAALITSHSSTEEQLREARHEVKVTEDRLGSQYEQKLMEVIRQGTGPDTQSIQASNTEDLSILRSQVLTLIKEVDEKQNNLTMAMAAVSNKDSRISELEEMTRRLQKEYSSYWTDSQATVNNLRYQLQATQHTQQENLSIKQQHHQLQVSFNQLVTDYKELVEMFEAQKNDAQRGGGQYNKDLMEELNRLTAQVMAADEAIQLRDEQITQLRGGRGAQSREAQQQELKKDEQIDLLKMQAECFETDFRQERDSREKLVEERDALNEHIATMRVTLAQLQDRNRQLTEELAGHNQRQINSMQRRVHGGQVRGIAPVNPPMTPMTNPNNIRPTIAGGASFARRPPATPPCGTAVDPPEDSSMPSLRRYDCPTCSAVFPDLDSLQLHVADCLEQAQ